MNKIITDTYKNLHEIAEKCDSHANNWKTWGYLRI